MANIQHKDIPDAERHEPKGISAASANTVYMANGSATGSWTPVNRLPGTGWGRYSNTTYTGTNGLPISTTNVLLPFTDAADESQLPISLSGTTTSLMDLSTEALKFVAAGDLHTITLTYKVYSVSGSPASMDLIIFGSSDGVTYATQLGNKTISLIKGAGQVVTETAMFPVSSDMVSYGAKIYLVTNTGTANIIDIGLITARVHKGR